jgi:hypothetical protein
VLQLFASVQVLVWELLEQVAQSVQVHDSVQEGGGVTVQLCVVAGLFTVVPQLLVSVQVWVWVPVVQVVPKPEQDQDSVQEGVCGV